MASEEKAPVKLAQSHEEHLRASMKRLVEVVPPEEEVRTRCHPIFYEATTRGSDLQNVVVRRLRWTR
jgi:hypothetical protein